MIDELMPGDRVAHKVTGRLATVLKIRTRWWRVAAARIRFDEDGLEYWVPALILQRIDKEER